MERYIKKENRCVLFWFILDEWILVLNLRKQMRWQFDFPANHHVQLDHYRCKQRYVLNRYHHLHSKSNHLAEDQRLLYLMRNKMQANRDGKFLVLLERLIQDLCNLENDLAVLMLQLQHRLLRSEYFRL